jgi:hypothetical protein
MLGSDRSPFLNRGVSRATFHAAGTWPEHRTARNKTAEQGCRNMLQRVVGTARNSMLNERRFNAVIASGRCVTCALDSTSHSSGNHRQGWHGKASCSTSCNGTCLRIVLKPCGLSTTEVSLNEMGQSLGSHRRMCVLGSWQKAFHCKTTVSTDFGQE